MVRTTNNSAKTGEEVIANNNEHSIEVVMPLSDSEVNTEHSVNMNTNIEAMGSKSTRQKHKEATANEKNSSGEKIIGSVNTLTNTYTPATLVESDSDNDVQVIGTMHNEMRKFSEFYAKFHQLEKERLARKKETRKAKKKI